MGDKDVGGGKGGGGQTEEISHRVNERMNGISQLYIARSVD